jgi:primosomal protein N' (replication factor Y)
MTEPARVVRVLPDVPAIDKTFDYLVPDAFGDQVRVGTMVRIELSGRRVGGWVIEDGVTPPDGVALRPLAKVTGWGPSADVIELARWAAWRWAGRQASFLGTASPERAVLGLPRGRSGPGLAPDAGVPVSPVPSAHDELIREAFARGRAGAVLRLPPAADPYDVALAAARLGNVLVLVPSVGIARHVGMRLRRAGVPVAITPKEWAVARAGAVVVGSRAGAWAPVHELAGIVVLDEHDEVYQEERSPTWHARDVVIERARRAAVPCVLVSPTPTLEALRWAGDGGVLVPARSVERDGWSIVDVIDRRGEEPGRAGLYSERFVKALRSEGTVVCVLNRKGRSRLLACVACGEATRCEHCDASVMQTDDGLLVCRRCATVRPQICQACGKTALKNLRAGVTRVREELEALANEPVVEITGDTADADRAEARIFVGTEAVLHQVPHAAVVAFLDFDQELLAPRYRAAEQAMSLVVRGMRLLARGAADRPELRAGRAALGRLVIQTRLPHHEVIQAALHADPSKVSSAELARRQFLRFPPVAALAAVSGPSAPTFIDALVAEGVPVGLEVLGPADGQWLIRAADHQTLCDALAATPRPSGRLRIEVDPLRI